MRALKAGMRLRSQVCATEIIVVVAPKSEIEIGCGGHPMVEIANGADADRTASLDPSLAGGTLLGKRYIHLATAFEALCTKNGQGSLTVNGERLLVKAATALPASD